MFDMLIRMLDPQGKEILPSSSCRPPSATTWSRIIDRWVIAWLPPALRCARKPGCLFVRLSRHSARRCHAARLGRCAAAQH